MTAQENKNIESVINNISYNIVDAIKHHEKQKKYKNEIDKVLGVLVNDGVYAYYVYVKAKKIDDIFLGKLEDLLFLLRSVGMNIDNNGLDQKFFENLSEDLTNLLLFRDILERILIYARYHAKAMLGDSDD